MKKISFEKFMKVQVRYLKYISKKKSISKIEAAQMYSVKMREKLEQKYYIVFH